MNSSKAKITYTDTDYGHQTRMDTTLAHIQGMGKDIFEACEGLFEGATKEEYIAAHAYHFGTVLGASGALIDLGDFEEGHVMYLVKMGYDHIKNLRHDA